MAEEEKPVFVRVARPQIQRPTVQPNVDALTRL
jgi:hypothetical protein